MTGVLTAAGRGRLLPRAPARLAARHGGRILGAFSLTIPVGAGLSVWAWHSSGAGREALEAGRVVAAGVFT